MASKHIVVISNNNFEQEVNKSPTPVLVDFWAEWCGPCKMIAPVLDEIAEEKAGKIKIAQVNVDEQASLAAEYGVRSIPTLLLIKGGQVAEQMVGARSKRDLKTSLDKSLA